MKSASILVLAAAVLAACGDVLPTAVEPEAATPRAPAAEISHAPLWGTPGFWFTWADPPPTPAQPFDATLSPTVEVCRITNGVCGPVLASFTRTSGSYGRRVTVNAAEEAYEVVWPTGSTGAQPGQVYRVSVRVGQRRLGFMDVRMLTSFWEYFSIDQDEYFPWVAGWNLTVGFHAEQGIPGAIQVPSSITLNVGEGKTFAPVVVDLHGVPIAGAQAYTASENTSATSGAVVVVDSGLVVGGTPGTATVYAWWKDLVVRVPATVTDTRRGWAAMGTPEHENVRALWGPGAGALYAATNVGVTRWDGAQWSAQEPVRWRSLHDVTGFSASNVWAVGDNGVIVRYDGTTWTGEQFDGTSVAALPLGVFEAPPRRIHLRGVWGSSPAHVVAVGDSGTVLVWNGSAWTTRASGVGATLTDVWGSSASNFYATTADGRILRFGATTVQVVPGVQAPGALLAVWGSSASNVYAVGEGGLVYRYDGASWSRIRLPTRATLYTVWGSSASEVYVGGAADALYRWDGTKWTPEKRAGTSAQIFGIWGTGAGIYAAGAGGTVSKR